MNNSTQYARSLASQILSLRTHVDSIDFVRTKKEKLDRFRFYGGLNITWLLNENQGHRILLNCFFMLKIINIVMLLFAQEFAWFKI